MLKPNLKIAIFTDSFYPKIDGVSTSTINLVKGLIKRGHKIYVIAPKFENKEELEIPNLIIKRIRGMNAFFYPDYKFTSPFSLKLYQYLKKEKIDLIHFHTPITLGIQAIIISKLLKIPLIGTFHTFITDNEYIDHLNLGHHFLKKPSWAYSKTYYHRADLITTPTKSAKRELLENNVNEPIKIISNGIDLKIFDNKNWKEKKKELNHSGKIILFVGRIAYEKNLPFLLECFKEIVKKENSVKLLIVGDGPQLEDLKRKVKEFDLEKRVILTGSIPHKELVKSGIYKASDIFITTSTTESQGITTMEAQANGLVCIGMNAKGTKDLIINNYNGFLIDKGNKKDLINKTLKLLTDNNLYIKMQKNTSKEIKKHDIEKIILEWEKTYRQVIQNYKLS